MTGLTHNTTYYLIRVSNTTFSLASSLLNAQNGAAITLSSNGTGAQTFTLTLSTRTLGDTGGEEKHAQTTGEVGPHQHTASVFGGTLAAGSGQFAQGHNNGSTATTDANTAGAAMNVMNPFTALNFIIKF